MEIRCEKCEAKFRVPDEKIPEGQQVIVSCPRCKNRLILKKDDQPSGVTSQATTREDYAYGDEDADLDFYEEGAALALVMADGSEQEQVLRHAVETLGYRYVSAKNSGEAIGKMRLHQFIMVIISDRFDGFEIEKSPVLNYLNRVPMSVRRHIFVVVIGDRFNTKDHMMAFALSVNLVIKSKDTDKIATILKHAVSDNEKFYKVFLETLSEVGKA